MPAQSKRRLKRFSKKKRELRVGKIRLLLPLIIFLFIYLYIIFTTKFWDKDRKLSIALIKGSGEVEVNVFDPTLGKISGFTLPADLQVESARSYGLWRLGSLKKLAKNENVGNILVVESIKSHLSLPIFTWIEGEDLSIKNILLASDTNLGFGDKVRVMQFLLRSSDFRKEILDLTKTSYLKRSVLKDGGGGFILVKDLPPSINSFFSEPYFSESRVTIQVVAYTKTPGLAEKVSKMIEVLGAKPASFTKESTDIDCIVTTKDKKVKEVLLKIFGCSSNDESAGGFTATLELGEEFAKRY